MGFNAQKSVRPPDVKSVPVLEHEKRTDLEVEISNCLEPKDQMLEIGTFNRATLKDSLLVLTSALKSSHTNKQKSGKCKQGFNISSG